MEDETIKIFDEQRNELGVASREEVHKNGYWHETFHCWFMSREDGNDYIYFQIRSEEKKDYPSLLDITVAGHLLADETIRNGIREVKEELGIDITYNELVPLGVIEDRIITDDFIDKEFANVFLYDCKDREHAYVLQKEEVAGIVKAEFKAFCELVLGKKDNMRVEGFEMNKSGKKVLMNKTVGKKSIVPHENAYFERIVKLINQKMTLLYSTEA